MNLRKLKRSAVFLAVFTIITVALLVRIWGLGWGHLYPIQHDERIHLHSAITFSQGELSPRVIWLNSSYPKYVFYPWFTMYIVAGVINGYEFLSDFIPLLLASPTMPTGAENAQPGLTFNQRALLIGRLTIAIMGAATVWVLYGIGRNLWDIKIGILSAALLTFVGYHIANCHWLKNDISTLFFMTLALFFISKIFTTGKLRYYIWSSIFSAVAINCKFHVFPIVVSLGVAHFLRERAAGKGRLRSLFSGRLLTAFLILLASLVASFPPIYLDPEYFRTNFLSWFLRMPSSYLLAGGGSLSFLEIRYFNIINFFRFSFMMEHGMGLWLTLLGLVGMIMALWKRKPRLVLTVTFPVVYLIVAILMASPGIRLQDTIPLYPYAALLSSVFILTVFQRLLKKKWLVNSAFWLAGAVLLFPYVRSTLRMDYGYWQPDTSNFATKWAANNIPPGSLIAREKKTLDFTAGGARVVTKRSLANKPVEAYQEQGFQYLVTSSRYVNRVLDTYGPFGPEHRYGRFYLSIESLYHLVKQFDLGDVPNKGGVITVYELKRSTLLCPGGLNSGLLRAFQHDFHRDSPPILFLNRLGRCEGNTNFLLPPESTSDRLLISPRPLSRIGIQITNGPRPGKIGIEAGGEKIRESFLPYETRQFDFPARVGFPYIQESYRVTVSSIWNSGCLVRILPDPFRVGLGYFRLGRWEDALEPLRRAVRNDPQDWYAYCLLARAAEQAGREVHDRLELQVPGFKEMASFLRDPLLKRSEWDSEFERLSGYDPVWLEERAALRWDITGLFDPLTGDNGEKIYRSPDFSLSPGEYRLRIEVSPGDEAALPVGLNLIQADRVVGRAIIPAENIDRTGEFEIDLNSTGFSLELTIPPEGKEWGGEIKLIPSLRSYVRNCLRDEDG